MLNKLKKFIVKLPGNKWVQIFLLVIAPFILTPKEFIVGSKNKRGIWRRIPIVAAGLSASGFFSLMLTSSIPYFITDYPLRSQDKWLVLSTITAVSFIIILIISTIRWGWNWVVFQVSRQFAYAANRAEYSYYWITSLSYIVWIGVFSFAAAVLFSGLSGGFSGVFSIINERPWVVLAILVVGALLQRRQRAISSDSEMILYPSSFSKFINFLPSLLLIITALLISIFTSA